MKQSSAFQNLPVERPVAVPQGDDHLDFLEFRVEGEALDLAGVEWEVTLSTRRGGTVLVEKTTTADNTASGMLIVNSDSGYGTLVMLAVDTSNLDPDSYFYNVVLDFPSTHETFPSIRRAWFDGPFVIGENATG